MTDRNLLHKVKLFAANKEISEKTCKAVTIWGKVWIGSLYLEFGWIFRDVSSRREAGIRSCMCPKETPIHIRACYVNEAEALPWVKMTLFWWGKGNCPSRHGLSCTQAHIMEFPQAGLGGQGHRVVLIAWGVVWGSLTKCDALRSWPVLRGKPERRTWRKMWAEVPG